jgi:hypothetical protein
VSPAFLFIFEKTAFSFIYFAQKICVLFSIKNLGFPPDKIIFLLTKSGRNGIILVDLLWSKFIAKKIYKEIFNYEKIFGSCFGYAHGPQRLHDRRLR